MIKRENSKEGGRHTFDLSRYKERKTIQQTHMWKVDKVDSRHTRVAFSREKRSSAVKGRLTADTNMWWPRAECKEVV